MSHGGKREGAGRKKGTVGRKTLAVEQKLAELKCDPIEGMAIIAKQAMGEGDLHLAGSMYKELAQYVAPKRKAVEVSGLDGEEIKTRSVIEILPVSASAD